MNEKQRAAAMQQHPREPRRQAVACPDGHQWHETADDRVCAACLLSTREEARRLAAEADRLGLPEAAKRLREVAANPLVEHGRDG